MRGLFFFLIAATIHAEKAQLSEQGRALMPVVLQSEELRPAATELSDMLLRITGAEFHIESGQEPRGIFLGLEKAAPALTEREDYSLLSKKGAVVIRGRSAKAVRHAVWDLLHRCGFRQLLPGKKWEIVPRVPSLSIDVNVEESPDYHARRIWAGFGYLKEREADCEQWNIRNRATSGILLNSGHAYDGIMRRHEAEFAAHPEFLALVDGKRQKPKFCISNADLRKLVVADALAQFGEKADVDSISCDPSDGGGWCECGECAKIGSVSDRALLLANEVAEAVGKSLPGRLIGMYAYNEHSPPPSIEAHPNVVISVATGFIRGGFTVDQLTAGWGAKVKTLGIREYYSVNTWDRDLPGAARGGNIEYLKTSIPHFHAAGARFMSAEASDNAASNGLGYYLAARMLWDVKEAQNITALTADFIDRAFGPARVPMARFYALLDGTKKQVTSDDLIGRMFRLLDEARALTTDEAVHARLDDLALYTQYCGLYLDYSSAAGKERQSAFEQLFRFIWRIRHTGMVHVKALWRDVPNRDKSVKLPPLGSYHDPDATNPWKSSEAFSREQIVAFAREGVAKRKLLDFEPVSYSTDLVPAAKLKLPAVPRGNAGIYLRGVRDFWTWIEKEPATLKLTGTAGIIYADRGTAKVELYPLAEAELKSVHHAEIEPDKQKQVMHLETRFPGLHRIEVSDSSQGTLIEWPEGMPMTIVSSQEMPAQLYGRWHLYFYVPRGTRVIGGFSSGAGFLLDPGGKTAYTFADKPGYFSVPVPTGQDGSLWSFKHSAGSRQLLTVPPCLARDASELLLPAEVVVKDAGE
ncbi:MAG: DUF4838 domain-containing protein [Verrucomicrobiaceae bacterium]|nr:DUF4838 domain-containing protein [Verrucomicrobiaceae bacterium]